MMRFLRKNNRARSAEATFVEQEILTGFDLNPPDNSCPGKIHTKGRIDVSY